MSESNETKLRAALQVIAGYPIPQQDDMPAANMRAIAVHALSIGTSGDQVPTDEARDLLGRASHALMNASFESFDLKAQSNNVREDIAAVLARWGAPQPASAPVAWRMRDMGAGGFWCAWEAVMDHPKAIENAKAWAADKGPEKCQLQALFTAPQLVERKAQSVSDNGAVAVGKYDEVLQPFVSLMERELHANAGKGDRPGWMAMSFEQIMLEIYYHAAKLQKALRDDASYNIGEHAADVANLAMMVADRHGLLDAVRAAMPSSGPSSPLHGPLTEAPEMGSTYWAAIHGAALSYTWDGDSFDVETLAGGHAFRTEADARAALSASQAHDKSESVAYPSLPLPEWTKHDDLGGRVPSDVRVAMREFGNACVDADRAQRTAPAVDAAVVAVREETRDQIFARVLAEADAAEPCAISPADALEFRRDAYGFTQTQMAAVLGMGKGHYSEVVNGRRKLSKTAMRRAVAIGVPAVTLLGMTALVSSPTSNQGGAA